jgi:CheY-like chemotaxis protein
VLNRSTGATGAELLTELRAHGEWPPLIVIMAHDAPGVRNDAEQHGVAAYLAKPFLGSALLGVIENVVGAARSA